MGRDVDSGTTGCLLGLDEPLVRVAIRGFTNVPNYYINNKGEKIGSLDIAISNDKSVTINRINDVTTVTVRDRITGKVSSETFVGDSPFGK
jgi:hypothetical protein